MANSKPKRTPKRDTATKRKRRSAAKRRSVDEIINAFEAAIDYQARRSIAEECELWPQVWQRLREREAERREPLEGPRKGVRRGYSVLVTGRGEDKREEEWGAPILLREEEAKVRDAARLVYQALEAVREILGQQWCAAIEPGNTLNDVLVLFDHAVGEVGVALERVAAEAQDAIARAMMPRFVSAHVRQRGQVDAGGASAHAALKVLAARTNHSEAQPWPSVRAIHDDLSRFRDPDDPAEDAAGQWVGFYSMHRRRFAASSVDRAARSLRFVKSSRSKAAKKRPKATRKRVRKQQ